MEEFLDASDKEGAPRGVSGGPTRKQWEAGFELSGVPEAAGVTAATGRLEGHRGKNHKGGKLKLKHLPSVP